MGYYYPWGSKVLERYVTVSEIETSDVGGDGEGDQHPDQRLHSGDIADLDLVNACGDDVIVASIVMVISSS